MAVEFFDLAVCAEPVAQAFDEARNRGPVHGLENLRRSIFLAQRRDRIHHSLRGPRFGGRIGDPLGENLVVVDAFSAFRDDAGAFQSPVDKRLRGVEQLLGFGESFVGGHRCPCGNGPRGSLFSQPQARKSSNWSTSEGLPNTNPYLPSYSGSVTQRPPASGTNS